MIKVAQAISLKSGSAKNTLAADYLKSRGITAKMPDSISFNPSVYIKKYDKEFPAMVVKLPDETSKIQLIHMTLLNSDTKHKAEVDQAKLKFGPVPSTINIDLNCTAPTKDVTLLAEGIETALSLKSALPDYDVKAALDKGGFSRIEIDKTATNVVLCLDNDLNNWREDKIITKAITRLTDANKTVWIAMPDTIDKQKTDFNDVLQHKGVRDIIQLVERAEKYNEPNLRLFYELSGDSQQKSYEKEPITPDRNHNRER